MPAHTRVLSWLQADTSTKQALSDDECKVDIELEHLSKGHKTPVAMLTNPIFNLREGLCPALLRCATRGIKNKDHQVGVKDDALPIQTQN